LAALAGCGPGPVGYEPPPETSALIVRNQGTSALNGIAEDWDGPEAHLFSLDPGDAYTVTFTHSWRFKLHAWRSSDGLLLIDDFWDVVDHKDGVEVTLYP